MEQKSLHNDFPRSFSLLSSHTHTQKKCLRDVQKFLKSTKDTVHIDNGAVKQVCGGHLISKGLNQEGFLIFSKIVRMKKTQRPKENFTLTAHCSSRELILTYTVFTATLKNHTVFQSAKIYTDLTPIYSPPRPGVANLAPLFFFKTKDINV